MTSFPAVGGYFGAVRVQRLKLWSSQPCVRPQGAGACLLYWGSSTQRAVISVGCVLFLRKHAAQLTCWQYVSAVVTTSRRLSSTSIGRRGRCKLGSAMHKYLVRLQRAVLRLILVGRPYGFMPVFIPVSQIVSNLSLIHI